MFLFFSVAFSFSSFFHAFCYFSRIIKKIKLYILRLMFFFSTLPVLSFSLSYTQFSSQFFYFGVIFIVFVTSLEKKLTKKLKSLFCFNINKYICTPLIFSKHSLLVELSKNEKHRIMKIYRGESGF